MNNLLSVSMGDFTCNIDLDYCDKINLPEWKKLVKLAMDNRNELVNAYIYLMDKVTTYKGFSAMQKNQKAKKALYNDAVKYEKRIEYIKKVLS